MGSCFNETPDNLKQMRYHGEYLKTTHWANLREKKIAKAKGRCQKCGDPYRLCVHHLTYENVGHEPLIDLVVLCYRCHAVTHGFIKEGLYSQKGASATNVVPKKKRSLVVVVQTMQEFNDYFVKNMDNLVALAASILKHRPELAEDIVHDVYVELAENEGGHRGKWTSSYIKCCVVWRAKSELGRRNRQAKPLADLPEFDEAELYQDWYG